MRSDRGTEASPGKAGKTRILSSATALVLLLAAALSLLSCAKTAKKSSKEAKNEGDAKITINTVRETSFEGAASGPVNILVLGSDSRTESIAGRSDAIILVHVDPAKKSATLISFPRDSRVPIPGRGNNKINSAMSFGGPKQTVLTIEQLTGIRIQYYAVTTFAGFIRIVDGLGGVRINLDKAIQDKWAGANLAAGPQELDGGTALAFCRSRHIPGGDFARAGHQQDLLVAALEQEKQQSRAERLLAVIDLVVNNCESNLSYKEMFELASILAQIEPAGISKTVLPGKTANIGGGSYVILDQAKLKEVFDGVKNGNGQ